MTTKTDIINTTCSGCGLAVVLDLNLEEARVTYKGNGKRGSLHVPGGIAVAELWLEDSDLLTWECPRCEYADSFEQD